MTLMAAAQKRLRMIARIFAETGLKALFLGVHALIRENATGEAKARLNGKWVAVDPTKWAERNDMTIEVGMGASGKDAELMMAAQMSAIMEKIIAGQGGAVGPIVGPSQVYNLAADTYRKLGAKKVDSYLLDPETQPAPEPKPDPEVEKARAKASADIAQTQMDGEIKAAQIRQDGELRKYQIDQELILKREQLTAELALKREQMAAEMQLKMANAAIRQDNSTSIGNVQVGGDPG